MKLSGEAHVWSFGGRSRVYAVVTLSYSRACDLILPYHFDATKGTGEQRALVDSHVKKLKKEMLAGNYTPTPVSAGLHPDHKKALLIDNGRYTLEVDPGTPLPQTNGQHRFAALADIRKMYLEQTKSEDAVKVEEANKMIASIDSLPITVQIALDGNPASDFVNLQASRAVDKAHMLALRIHQDETDPAAQMAFRAARQLHNHEESPFRDMVRFDSRGTLPLPVTTLCSRGASDIATSLVGLSRVAIHFEKEENHASFAVVSVFKAISELAPDLQGYGKVLTPMKDGGKKGPSTMYSGLASCLLFRLLLDGRVLPTEEDKKHLAECATETLDEFVEGGFSSARKRELMGRFAKRYFSDVACQLHHGVPTDLVRILSSSTFGVEKLPNVRRRGSRLGEGQQESTSQSPATDRQPAKGQAAMPESGKDDKPTPAPQQESEPTSKKSPEGQDGKSNPVNKEVAKGNTKKATTKKAKPKSSPAKKASTKKATTKGTTATKASPKKSPQKNDAVAALPIDKAPWD